MIETLYGRMEKIPLWLLSIQFDACSNHDKYWQRERSCYSDMQVKSTYWDKRGFIARESIKTENLPQQGQARHFNHSIISEISLSGSDICF